MISLRFVVCCLLFAVAGCHSKTNTPQHQQPHCIKEASLPVKYAKGFAVDYYNGFKVVSVKDVKDSSKIMVQYVLLPKGKAAPVDFATALLIDTPVTKVICISTTHIAEMQRLGLLPMVAGVTNRSLIYSKEVQAAMDAGTIADLGSEEINYEKLLELNPSFVFTSGSYDGGDKLKSKLDALHIKTVLNLDYLEQDPLARAEWLKFIGAFFDMEYEADSIFTEIETNYLALREKAKGVTVKPTVFCNIPFKEVWYMPSGQNYTARLIADAGGDFLWKETQSTNGLNLNLDYEAVYSKAAEADIWLGTGFAKSLAEIKAADKKNALFKAYQTGRVYNNDLRNTPSGGFDFWESGVVNPDKALADLLFIFHPELMPGHELYYYRKLK
jgi:iron complex transport system substrate-binding protein